MDILVRVVVCVGMLVVIPVGMALVVAPGLATVRRLWPMAAAAGVVCLWLPRGELAVSLAAVYAVATLGLAAVAVARFAATRLLVPREIAVLTAFSMPAVAGTALVAERGGWRLFGFPLPILGLTVAHFHYAGFAAALLAGLVAHAAADTVAATVAAVSVPLGTSLVLAGFFAGDLTQFAGAGVLTAGMWTAAWVSWHQLRTRTPDRLTRALLGISALVLVATMLLALNWAFGKTFGTPTLSIGVMAATHGLANALGFAVCGLLAWRRLPLPPV